MQILIDKIENTPFDKIKLRQFLLKTAANELTKLSEPCYYPEVEKYYYDILYIMNLEDSDIKQYVKRFYEGLPSEKWLLESDPYTNLLIFIMHYFLIQRDQAAFTSTMIFFVERYYANVMKIMIKFCNKSVFSYTLDNLSGNHLFLREKTISNSLYYLAKEFQKKHTESILKRNPEKVGLFIREARTRIMQSCKSLATSYYKFHEEGKGYQEIKDDTEKSENPDFESKSFQTKEIDPKIIDDTVKKITVYRFINEEILSEASKVSKINKKLASKIAIELSNTKYSEEVRPLLKFFSRRIENVKQLCGKEYYDFIRSLMFYKKTTDYNNFKIQVTNITHQILKNTNALKNFDKLSSTSKYNVYLFVAHYITLYMRKSIC